MPAYHARLPQWNERNPDQKLELLHALVDDLYGFLMQPAYRHLASLLQNHIAADEEEKRSIEQIHAMMGEYTNLFSPMCLTGHITGSALIIDPARERVLLTFHAKLQRWLQMGGHSEFELDPAEIALREAREESGLGDLRFMTPDSLPSPEQDSARFMPVAPVDIDVHLIPARQDNPAHYHLDFRYVLATATPENIQINQTESRDLRWFDFDELTGLNPDRRLLRLIEKAQHLIADNKAR